jgi:NAD(P) transhydrogenase subunit alpha
MRPPDRLYRRHIVVFIDTGELNMPEIVALLTIFILAGFVGYEIITKIPATLHTPLMSGANAISGITLVGAVVSAGSGSTLLTTILGFIAVVMATINVVGGFMVTHRMLGMFRKKESKTDMPEGGDE